MHPESTVPPTHEEIASCAYLIWHLEGRPEGRALEHWLQAEGQLIAAHHHEQWAPPGGAERSASEPEKPAY